MTESLLKLRVASVRDEAAGIKSYVLVDPAGGELPSFKPGAHIIVHLGAGLNRQYSLLNDCAERDRFVLGVLREKAGRGGSARMADQIKQGDLLEVSQPHNNFPLNEGAERYILIAGGIGVTPIYAMARRLHALGKDFTLHYCTRAPEVTAFREEMAAGPFADKVKFHHDGGDPAKGLDVKALLATPAPGTEVYCCGPTGLMNAVQAATAHWPKGSAHFEFFSADPSALAGDSNEFEVEIASSGKVLKIPADRSILDVLDDEGIEVERICTEGVCGSCITGVLEGEIDHRDSVLTDEEHEEGKLMTLCCSRAKSKRLKIDL